MTPLQLSTTAEAQRQVPTSAKLTLPGSQAFSITLSLCLYAASPYLVQYKQTRQGGTQVLGVGLRNHDLHAPIREEARRPCVVIQRPARETLSSHPELDPCCLMQAHMQPDGLQGVEDVSRNTSTEIPPELTSVMAAACSQRSTCPCSYQQCDADEKVNAT